MRSFMFAAAIALGSVSAGLSASAMPALQSGPLDSGITTVAQGCGPGGHRDYYGRCVPNFRGPGFRACPPGFHLSPYRVCRPNF